MFGGLWVGGCISATTIGQILGFFCAISSVHSTPTTEKNSQVFTFGNGHLHVPHTYLHVEHNKKRKAKCH